MPDNHKSSAPTIGILGAGRLGAVLARLAVNAGYSVTIAGSGAPSTIGHRVHALAPGATVARAIEAAKRADIVILALPLNQYTTLPVEELRNKIVIDATNYWWGADGIHNAINDPRTSTSEIVQAFLPDSRVIKAFNHMGYQELEEDALPSGVPGRKAIALAGDYPADVSEVAALIDAFGFDPVIAGPLAEGVRMEPHTELFGSDVDADDVRAMLSRFPRSARGIVVSRARESSAQ